MLSKGGGQSGFDVSDGEPSVPARLDGRDARRSILKSHVSEMRRRAVDDVQLSCYYQKVPRVKSGLPVCGSLLCCATCVGDKFRENLG